MPLSKIQDIGNQVVPTLGPRNAIINGAMQVSQRSTSEAALGNGSTDIVRTVDRIKFSHDSTTGRITMSQNSPTDLPGFTKSVKLQVTTALASPAAGNYIQLKYGFEGQQLQHFAKGTSTAKVMALSFYVKGNGNATYMCELEDHDNGRNNQQQFSVTSSWNRVQLLYAGDTTGAFGNDANLSMSIIFWLVAGSTYSGGSYTANTWASPTTNKRAAGISNLYSSTSNFIEITGLQLEPIQVTEFEHELYAVTYEKARRYYQQTSSNVQSPGFNYDMKPMCSYRFPVTMRAAPTVALISGAYADGNSSDNGGISKKSGFGAIGFTSPTSANFNTGTEYFRFHYQGGSFNSNPSEEGNGLMANIAASMDAEL